MAKEPPKRKEKLAGENKVFKHNRSMLFLTNSPWKTMVDARKGSIKACRDTTAAAAVMQNALCLFFPVPYLSKKAIRQACMHVCIYFICASSVRKGDPRINCDVLLIMHHVLAWEKRHDLHESHWPPPCPLNPNPSPMNLQPRLACIETIRDASMDACAKCCQPSSHMDLENLLSGLSYS